MMRHSANACERLRGSTFTFESRYYEALEDPKDPILRESEMFTGSPGRYAIWLADTACRLLALPITIIHLRLLLLLQFPPPLSTLHSASSGFCHASTSLPYSWNDLHLF